jgi:putative ABC transport system permease protein
MSRLNALWSRISETMFRRSRESRLTSEIEHHLDMLADELAATGMPRDEARLAARRQFGNVDRIRIVHREQRGFPSIDSLAQDVRFGIRVLVRDRGFALTAMLVLGLGIGVNNLFFTLVYTHKYRGLPIAQPDRVLSISVIDDRGQDRPLTPNEFDTLAGHQSAFAALAAHVSSVVTVGDNGRAADRHDASYISSNALSALGIAPILGRLPSVGENDAGAPPVTLLGAEVWRSRYDADPGILGRSILINGAPATVIGVLPDRAGFPTTAKVWLPIGQSQSRQRPDARAWRVFGRLHHGAVESDARAQIDSLLEKAASTRPASARLRARVVPLNQQLLGDLSGWGPFIMAGIIVILVACANVANLMIARAVHRAREVAVRTSLGASRARIVHQLLVEAAAIAAGGGFIGGLFSLGGVRLFQSAIPEGTLPYWFDYSMDTRVFVALVMMSLATVVMCGLVPALQASRTDVNKTLKDGGRGNMGHAKTRAWTAAFLTAELALAMVMLTQVAIATLTNSRPLPTDDTVHTTSVTTAAITLPADRYRTAEQRTMFFRALQARFVARPEFAAATRTSLLPGEGGGTQDRLMIEGRSTGDTVPEFLKIEIAPEYFTTLQLPLVKGRAFTERDSNPGSEAAIVNERFVSALLGGADPLGLRVAVPAAPDTPLRWLTIVGVAPVVRQQGGGGVDQQTPVIYTPIDLSAPATSILMIRDAGETGTIAAAMRADVQALDQNVALYRMRTLARAIDDAQWNRRVSSYLASTVCLLSVLLAVVGLYAVTAQRVALKTQEIGLRMALGARGPQVARVVLAGLRWPLLLGLMLGTLGTIAWDRAFASETQSIAVSASRSAATIAALIAVVVFAACIRPLIRAVRLSPLDALRHE